MGDKGFRDSSGRTLADYPRPSVAVDAALLTPDPERGLMVLQVKRTNTTGWGLPGTFLHPGERLADAVRRALRVKAGIDGVSPHQLQVFDEPDRDERGWVLSVGHWAVVPVTALSERFPSETRLMPVDNPGRLIYDHRRIIDIAVAHIRSRYASAPDPDHLLGEAFTVRELRLLHELVEGRPLDRDWFRREMEGSLQATEELSVGTRGRPARLFTRRSGASV